MDGPKNIDICLIIVIILTTWLVSEVFSYFWHRFVSHLSIDNRILGKYLFRGVKDSHKDHHFKFNMDESHKALEDFLWVVTGLCCLGVFWYSISLLGIVHDAYLVASMTTSVVFGLWKCFIHAAYHTDNHILNKFSFFREWKREHYVHHEDPKSNFSLSWFIPDKIFGTYRDKIIKKEIPISVSETSKTNIEDID